MSHKNILHVFNSFDPSVITLIHPILQMQKLRYKEFMYLAQGHTASN